MQVYRHREEKRADLAGAAAALAGAVLAAAPPTLAGTVLSNVVGNVEDSMVSIRRHARWLLTTHMTQTKDNQADDD
jgi:hypothetical protein